MLKKNDITWVAPDDLFVVPEHSGTHRHACAAHSEGGCLLFLWPNLVSAQIRVDSCCDS